MPLGRDPVAAAEQRLTDLRAQLAAEAEQHHEHTAALAKAEERKHTVVEDPKAYSEAGETADRHRREIDRLEIVFEKRAAEIEAAQRALDEARIDAEARELDRGCKARAKAAAAFNSTVAVLIGQMAELQARRSEVADTAARLGELGGGERPWPADADEPNRADVSELVAFLQAGPVRPNADSEAAAAHQKIVAARQREELLQQAERSPALFITTLPGNLQEEARARRSAAQAAERQRLYARATEHAASR